MNIEAHNITTEDLERVNRFTLRELAEDEVYIFAAKFIDSEPTSNGRIWSREWQESAVKRNLFDGVPFLTNHENDQGRKIGTVISAELREDGIYGRVFVPLDDPGKQAKEAIENGRIKNVSINADGDAKQEGKLTRILPTDNMRVYEVSAVAVGGCKSCTTLKENMPSEESCRDMGIISTAEDEQHRLLEFAAEQFGELKKEFVKLAGLSLGSSIKRDLLQQVADQLDPLTLKEFSRGFYQAYQESSKGSPGGGREELSPETAALNALNNIRKTKGA